mgnify:CR=1 FL=1
MASKLLLDFDGVVLRNKHILSYQVAQSAKFVHRHVPYLSLSECTHLNRLYYPQYGHTVIMMNKMMNVPVTLEDYNDFVFHPKKLQKLEKLIDDDTCEYAESFLPLFNEFDTGIFTNAHINWVEMFCKVFELPVDESNIYWPMELELLKPNPQAYTRVAFRIKTNNITFVDDSAKNIEFPKYNLKWNTILYRDMDTPTSLIQKVKV